MKFIHYDTVTSTNAVVQTLASAGKFGPLWVRADIQTDGRGRRGREWVSQKGNLFTTGLYPVAGDALHTSHLSFAAALAVYDLIVTYVNAEKVQLKWPNDIMIDGAKASGILLERGSSAGHAWIAIGVGVNFVSNPPDTHYPTTHVLAHMASPDIKNPEPLYTGLEGALAILANQFNTWRNVLLNDGFVSLRKTWLKRALGIPGPVQVNLTHEKFSGEAIDLGPRGELQVRQHDGTLREVYAGDVFFN